MSDSSMFLIQVMKDSQLFLIVGILLTIDIVIMTTWQVFDPFFRDTYDLRPYVSFLSDKIVRDRIVISIPLYG
jgi:gamma-aminobutyric acid type B receptor